MIGACLVTLAASLVAAQGPDSDPAELVRKLGSGRFAERVEATKALEALGPLALPALRESRDAVDPQVRVRVAALLESIGRRAESSGLLRPTPIRLDFRDRPLSEVVETLNDRDNLGLAVQFAPPPGQGAFAFVSKEQEARRAEALSRRITLEAPDPLPFWEAIDRLCRASGLRHDLDPQGHFSLSPGRFLLRPGPGETGPASDDGPFRVVVAGLQSTFEVDFATPDRTPNLPEGRPVGGRLDLRMAVLPEAGRVVRQVGPPSIVEATDDRGRSLLPPEPAKAAPPADRGVSTEAPHLNGGSGFGLSAALRLPDQSARSIGRLRGMVPVVIVARAEGPIVIPLAGSVGKSARKGEVTVTIHEVAVDAQGGLTVEVGVVPDRPVARPDSGEARPAVPDFVAFHPDRILNRLELVDARGRALALDYTQGHGRDHATISSRFRLTPSPIRDDLALGVDGVPQPPRPARPVPVELRFHGFAQVTTEVRFDFRDIPLP